MNQNNQNNTGSSYNLRLLLNNLLSIYAGLNLLILFFYNYLLNIELFHYINIFYTNISISILAASYIYCVVIERLSITILRRRMVDLMILIMGIVFYREPIVFQILLIGRQTYIILHHTTQKNKSMQKMKRFTDNAAIFILLSFLITIIIGTALLMLPVSTAEGNRTTLSGAIFTATSATCVTGLIVYDTGTHFSMFGQVIILLLFQIGGLGIMTISTSFAILTGQRLSLRGESIMQNVVDESSRIDMFRLVKNILLVTLIFELIGTLLMYFVFRYRYPDTTSAIFSSIFHSVSSFCNAGFSLFSDSFVPYRSNWLLNFTAMTLIVFGGIGFYVLVDLKRNMIEKFKPSRFSLHTKLVLSATVILILSGFLLFFVTEYNHTMKGFSLGERVLGSLFQSVTSRTAGFNTLETSRYSNASSFGSMFLMFVGASPGSTGGGIKTTSFAIIILSVLAIFFGNKDVVIFKRKIPDSLIKRVMALIAVSLLLLFAIIVLLMIIEPFSFERIMFEAFSAFGTVGLSMGITSELSEVGRILIVFLMYFGRVGPLTFLFALSGTKLKTGFTYAEERVSVG